MPAGDALAVVLSVPANGAVVFQPASETEFMITYINCYNNYLKPQDYDGSVAQNIFANDITIVKPYIYSPSSTSLTWQYLRMPITNSVYIRFVNDAATTLNAVLRGVRTK